MDQRYALSTGGNALLGIIWGFAAGIGYLLALLFLGREWSTVVGTAFSGIMASAYLTASFLRVGGSALLHRWLLPLACFCAGLAFAVGVVGFVIIPALL